MSHLTTYSSSRDLQEMSFNSTVTTQFFHWTVIASPHSTSSTSSWSLQNGDPKVEP
jgi:hypothetical protein